MGAFQSDEEKTIPKSFKLSQIYTFFFRSILDAEVRMGELLKGVPKAKENQYTKVPIDSSVERQKPKSEVIADAGLTQKQAEYFDC